MRNKKIDSSFPQTLARRIAVVCLVADHSLGTGSGPSRSSFGDFDFCNVFSRSLISAGEAESVWLPRGRPLPSTSTMHFVPFPRLVFPTPAPLFLPERSLHQQTPLPSRGLHWSNSERKARHMSLRTSASYHSLRRRQQVEGCGYRSGRSFHLAPVLSIQRIPSNTKRSSALGRPPFGRRSLRNKGFDLLATAHRSNTLRVYSPDLPPAS